MSFVCKLTFCPKFDPLASIVINIPITPLFGYEFIMIVVVMNIEVPINPITNTKKVIAIASVGKNM